MSGRPAAGADARTLRSLGSSLLIYRAFGLWNPLGLGDEGRMLAVLERVFLLERQIAVLEAARAARTPPVARGAGNAPPFPTPSRADRGQRTTSHIGVR